MREVIAAACLLRLFGLFAASTGPGEAPPEKAYFETRGALVRHFASMKDPVDQGPALAQLEKQVRALVGPVSIDGFPREGTFNLTTLLEGELESGSLDGLRFESGPRTVVVTTRGLLGRHAAEQNLPKGLPEVSRDDRLYTLAFHNGAAATHYAELPLGTKPDEPDFSYAFLGVFGQDIGPYPPGLIFVFVAKGDRILIGTSPACVKVTDISECRREWERRERQEEQAFEAYCKCFDGRARNPPFFTHVARQAQSLGRLLQGRERPGA